MKAMDLAYYIVKVAYDMNKPVSNLEMLKILYFLHRDFSNNDARFIHDEEFQAWPYGRVIPSVYFEFSINAARPIVPPINYREGRIDPNINGKLREAIQFYASKTPWDLVGLSHVEGGAWHRACNDKRLILDQKDILNEKASHGARW